MPTMAYIFILLTSAACIFQLISAQKPSKKLSFGVALASGTSRPGLLNFTEVYANGDQTYNRSRASFSTNVDGFYYMLMCIGAAPGSKVTVRQAGGYPSLSYTWQSTDNASVQLGCSGGITRVRPRSGVGLVNGADSNIYSSSPLQTSWSGFSINGAMNSTRSALFVSCKADSLKTIGPIPLNGNDRREIYVNPTGNAYNSAKYTYTCGKTGTYLVSMSVGILAGQVARVQLTGLKGLTFELTHTRPANNGLVMVSRSVLFNCTKDSGFQLSLKQGVITSGGGANHELISLTVVHYEPINGVASAAAWSGYRSSNWAATGQSETLVYTRFEVLYGVEHTNGRITIQQAGNYMVYLSAATEKDYPVNLSLKRNGNTILGLEAAATDEDGVRMLDNGIIVSLNSDDQLEVVSHGETQVFSSDGLQVGFFGFRITA